MIAFAGCTASAGRGPQPDPAMPQTILWAWERPEDLRAMDPQTHGVAFLAQTVNIKNGEVTFKPRRQPLDLPPAAYLIAVTRIETDRRSAIADDETAKIISLFRRTLELPNVRAVQIDFDAAVSERPYYTKLLGRLRRELPAGTPLSMTALASWCFGDSWLRGLPVDEAVPMVFRMGSDSDRVRSFLKNGNDWSEPLCRASYGLSTDEPIEGGLQPGRRRFILNSRSWSENDFR